jgi:cytochrome P450
MRTVWYNLLAHPKTLERLREELLAEASKKEGGSLSQPFPAWKEICDLPYLDACINEAVRLHPPFCLPLERVVPAGGMAIGGTYFPEGTVVGMSPWVVNRHRPTFGEDANDWRPERWLGPDEDRRKLEQSVLTVCPFLLNRAKIYMVANLRLVWVGETRLSRPAYCYFGTQKVDFDPSSQL